MEEVDLAPFQRSLGTVGSVGSARLNALDVANVLDLVGRAVAVIIATGNDGGNQGSKPGEEAEGDRKSVV